ncbi:M16 family metallopeptidase [Sphingobacterium rhinopitheci]|uniref:M16 family metallopeptidase n=1 Tax=Sphingobacterium rhinopitheci TaxID=2781960 RepID=UPI001F524BDA|nr:insulinase family protein [Sphingobacterium rhinopitheci]MCI0920471.1 insulinase family protein [Sphingobacterium rhinopitheci]
MIKTIQRISLIALLLLPISQVCAQQKAYKWEKATESGYSYQYVSNDPTHSRFYILKNGLTVILSPNKKEPRIQTYIATKAGSKTDPKDHTGLAHYLEHMLFKGTDKLGTLDWAKEKPLLDQIDNLYDKYNSSNDEKERKSIYKEIDKVSGEAAKYAIANEYDKVMGNMGSEGSNAFTSFEQTVYIEDIPNNVLDKFLTVQAERFRNPILRLFHTELESVYEEKNIGLDNDNRKAIEAMFEAMFPNNNYGKQTVIGTIEHLKNPSLKAIREYYNTYYVPNNMGIIMSGDFDPNVVIKKIDAAFSYMQSKPIPAYTFDLEKPITTHINREVKGQDSEYLFLGFRFPGAINKDAKMLSLLGNMLTNGSAGLIDLNLVKSQKLLGAGAFPYVLKDYSILILQGRPSQGQTLTDVKNLLLGELEKLRKGDFSEDLITSIVNNERKGQIIRNDNYKYRADELMSAFTSELDWANELSNTEWLATITKKDIVEFANKYLNNQNYVAVYKRQGQDENVVKVEKPEITPISVNFDAESDFLTQVNEMPEASIEPMWVNYTEDIQKAKLKGLNILAVENKENELFSLIYRFNTGKWNDKKLGLAASYLQYLGTKNKSSEDFSKDFYKLATDFNISSGNEETNINISGLSSNFKPSVKLLHDLVNNCIVDEEAFEAYIDRLKKSRKNAKENKDRIMEGLRSYARYGANNPFNYTFTDAELDNLKAQDLVQVLHNLANMEYTILYFGPEKVEKIAKTLPTLKVKNTPYLKTSSIVEFKEIETHKNKVLFAPYKMQQVEIFWLKNSGSYDVSITPTVALFNNYFGGGMGSIVFQTIRESKALAYSTYAYFSQPTKKENKYFIGAYIGTQTDKFNEATQAMNELLNTLPESANSFETSKQSLLKSIASERVINTGILNNYIVAQRLGNTTDIRKNTFEQIPNLTFNDLKNFHKKEFSQKPYVYCIVGDEENLRKESMEKLGEFQKLTLDQIFGY